MDRKGAMKIWQNDFGKAVETVDFAGRKINKSAFEQKFSKYGWTVVNKLPKNSGGNENESNRICVHLKTAEEKSDNFPFFIANDKKFEIITADDGQASINEVTDSESLAMQQAKTLEAAEKWDEFFGEGYEVAIDFCGRKICKSEFNTESEFAWKVAPYVESKPAENKNAYIANIASIEEALGKTAFKANGKNYSLNKENGAYFFKLIDSKPQKRQFSIEEPADMLDRLRMIAERYTDESSLRTMLDFIIIRAVTKPGCTAGNAAAIPESVSMILKEKLGDCVSSEFSEMADESGSRYMFMTFRYTTPTPAELEKVFSGALLLNTYSEILSGFLNLEEFKIYNFADFVACEQVHYPVGLLAEFNPTFKALMNSIYGSAYGYHVNESRRTLYVSHFIVYNVPSLQAIHPEDNTVYFTEAEMIEHNYPDEAVAEKIKASRDTASEAETNDEQQSDSKHDDLSVTEENAGAAEGEKENESSPAINDRVDSDADNSEKSENFVSEATDNVEDPKMTVEKISEVPTASPLSEQVVAESSEVAENVAVAHTQVTDESDSTPVSEEVPEAGETVTVAETQYAPASEPSVTPETQYTPAIEPSVIPETQYAPASEPSVAHETQYVPVSEPSVAPETQYAPANEPSVIPETQYAPASEPSVAPETQYVPASEPSVIPETQCAPVSEPSVIPETQCAPVSEPSVAPETQYAPAIEPNVIPETQYVPASEPSVTSETQCVSVSEPSVIPETQYAPVSEPSAAPETQYAPASEPSATPETQYVPASEPSVAPKTQYAPASEPSVAPETQYAPASEPSVAPEEQYSPTVVMNVTTVVQDVDNNSSADITVNDVSGEGFQTEAAPESCTDEKSREENTAVTAGAEEYHSEVTFEVAVGGDENPEAEQLKFSFEPSVEQNNASDNSSRTNAANTEVFSVGNEKVTEESDNRSENSESEKRNSIPTIDFDSMFR